MPNYTNKITIMNLLGIIIGVCLFLMFCHMLKLLGKRARCRMTKTEMRPAPALERLLNPE